jgi:hypothetical protein
MSAFTTSNRGPPEEGRRYRRAQRLRLTALVEAGGMVERGRLEALRACMMSGVPAPLASRKVRNKSIASFQGAPGRSAIPPQLLTYRRGAANRRFGPAAEVAATVEPTLRASAQHCASTLTFSQQVSSRIAPRWVTCRPERPNPAGFGEPTPDIMRFRGARIRSVWSWR